MFEDLYALLWDNNCSYCDTKEAKVATSANRYDERYLLLVCKAAGLDVSVPT